MGSVIDMTFSTGMPLWLKAASLDRAEIEADLLDQRYKLSNTAER